MHEYRYGAPAEEKPLDHLVSDGGFTAIFRTIACVGDSLSSGEFEIEDAEDKTKHHFYDMMAYSFGQFLARAAGSTAYNFSRGGLTAREFCDGFAESRGWWNPALRAQAYIFALGVNDLIAEGQPLGEMSDINPDDPSKNAPTFTGYFARIMQQYKAIAPDAKFFLVTLPRNETYDLLWDGACGPLFDAHAARMHELAAYFDNTYVIDLRAYAPPHNAEYIKRFHMLGHLNPMGYRIFAEQVGSYIDYIIRHNPEDFKMVGFINNEIPMLW